MRAALYTLGLLFLFTSAQVYGAGRSYPRATSRPTTGPTFLFRGWGTQCIVPLSAQAPRIDGLGDDECWRGDGSEAGAIATPAGLITCRVNLAADQKNLYLLLRGFAASPGASSISIIIQGEGPSPFRIDVDALGRTRHFNSVGPHRWQRSPKPLFPGVLAAGTPRVFGSCVELSLPRIPLVIPASGRVRLLLTQAIRGEQALAILDLRRGLGIRLGGQTDLNTLHLEGRAGHTGKATVTLLHHGPALNHADLECNLIPLFGGEPLTWRWSLPRLRSGRSEHHLKIPTLPDRPIHHLVVRLTHPSGAGFITELYTAGSFLTRRPHLPSDLYEALPPKLARSQENLLRRRGEDEAAAAFIDSLNALGSLMSSMPGSIKMTLPMTLGMKLAEGNTTAEQELADLIQTWQGTPEALLKENAPSPLEDLTRARACTEAAATLLATPNGASCRRTVVRLLTCALALQRRATLDLFDPRVEPLPEAIATIAQNAARLAFLPESKLVIRSAVKQAIQSLTSATYPDGAPRVSAQHTTSRVASLMATTTAADTAHCLTEELKLLCTACLPALDYRYPTAGDGLTTAVLVPGSKPNTNQDGAGLKLKAAAGPGSGANPARTEPGFPKSPTQYLPYGPAIMQWRKKVGLDVIPVKNSVPLGGLPVYGGRYQLRSPSGVGKPSLTVNLAPESWPDAPASLSLKVWGKEFLILPPKGVSLRSITIDDAVPSPDSAPPAGLPLPWQWNPSPFCDLVTAEWTLPRGRLVSRSVLLVKGRNEKEMAAAFILDRVSSGDGTPHRATQSFLTSGTRRMSDTGSGFALHGEQGKTLHLLIPDDAPAVLTASPLPETPFTRLSRTEKFTGRATLLMAMIPSPAGVSPTLKAAINAPRRWTVSLGDRGSLTLVQPLTRQIREQQDNPDNTQSVITNAELAVFTERGGSLTGLLLLNGTKLSLRGDKRTTVELSEPASALLWVDPRGEMTATIFDCDSPLCGLTVKIQEGSEERTASVSLDLGARIKFRPF